MKNRRCQAFLGLLLLLGACQSKPATNETIDEATALFREVPATQTGIEFANTLAPDKALNILTYNYYYNGGGVAVADFNRDGRPDLYFTGNQVSSRLYLNESVAGKAKFAFADATLAAGVGTTDWATGVAVVDINTDGLPDIYVCMAGYPDARRRANRLFVNTGPDKQGVPHFQEKASQHGLADTGYSTHASFFDYDRDGDLDCYVVNHDQSNLNPNYPKEKALDGSSPSNDQLYRNDGGHFANVTRAAGILLEGYGLSASVADVNNDGWPDIYVANDFIFDDLLYLNNHNGTFTESLKQAVGHTSRFSMGSDIADYNNDGWPDIFVADMMPEDHYRQKLMNQGSSNDIFTRSLQVGYLPQYSRNVLQLNNGPLPGPPVSLREIGQLAGVNQTDWSWSPLFVDLDNDGWKDLYITNGIPHDITSNDFVAHRAEEVAKSANATPATVLASLLKKVDKLPPVDKPDVAFQNKHDLTFADKSVAWGLARRGCSNGAVYADLDQDGDLDLVTNNVNAPASVLENRSEQFSKNRSLRLRLDGPGVGAKIRVVAGGQAQFVEHRLQRGFQSSQENVVHLGMGTHPQADTVDVLWPSGRFQRLLGVRTNQLLTLREQQATRPITALRWPAGKRMGTPLFADVTATHKLDFTPIENDIEEFNVEPLLPHRFSRQGPCIAVGDVNGDGRDDFFVGGAAKIAGQLFLQTAAGTFTTRPMPDPGFEDTGAVFFDADGDKDLDLYVVSGGNEYNPLTAAYQDRLYLNDARGNFTRNKAAIPVEYASGFSVATADFDRDGDMDLFVGGRVVPSQYPLPAESFLLQNDGKGHFENVIDQVCPLLKHIGLVTAALWADANNDQFPDLLVAGEWMPLTLFQNRQGRVFEAVVQPALATSAGWWSSLAAGDFDHDGDMDYVAGNVGLNTRLKAPLGMYAKDFDGNGTIESVMTHWLGGREVPYLSRDMLAIQYPAIKKKFPSHDDYAGADFAALFSPAELADAVRLNATELRSVYLENRGNGQFTRTPLPLDAQVAPIQSMLVRDINGDGHLDVVAAGNWFDPDFMLGRFDAGGVNVLLGDGRGHYKSMSKQHTGLHVAGDVRTIRAIRIGGLNRLLVGSNSAQLQLLAIDGPTLLRHAWNPEHRQQRHKDP